jgi:hypothetical protein
LLAISQDDYYFRSVSFYFFLLVATMVCRCLTLAAWQTRMCRCLIVVPVFVLVSTSSFTFGSWSYVFVQEFDHYYRHLAKRAAKLHAIYPPELPKPLSESEDEKAVQERFKEMANESIDLAAGAMRRIPAEKWRPLISVREESHFRCFDFVLPSPVGQDLCLCAGVCLCVPCICAGEVVCRERVCQVVDGAADHRGAPNRAQDGVERMRRHPS